MNVNNFVNISAAFSQSLYFIRIFVFLITRHTGHAQ